MNFNAKSSILLIIRILLGIVCLAHGGQKLFGWFGGSGADAFINQMASLNVPEWLAYSAILTEFFGGLMILLGIGAELGAAGMACIMIGGFYLIHGQHGFFIQNNGYEYAFCLMVLALIIVVYGPGEYSVWNVGKQLRN